ncbi:hypothetical protein BDBG_06761 [Blastomyces gilchristii SLH14081]|uniref:Zn(2)-C6 fungal-type domain-containing protein n=1 Tax=Blastomyces gilchristii (strain SLH14081) TaxID=559298 RepID=A0A179UT90_BLAGS|nr:uncharacterized protein BDBG_06761 [Blastomyces gilchristii SLH14081]OAT11003.1 hypothetical protein BDBG_06761 [Blastomyces gilchristii SLH14081]
MTGRRSRGGCAQCLQQHRKCDEGRPRCGRCARLNINCEYKKNIRWVNGPHRHQRRRPRDSPHRESWDDLLPTTPDLRVSHISSLGTPSGLFVVQDEHLLHLTNRTNERALSNATGRTHGNEAPSDDVRRMQTGTSILQGQDPTTPGQRPADEEEPVLNEARPVDGELVRISETTPSSLELRAWETSLNRDISSFLLPTAEESIAYVYFLRSVAMIMSACDSTQNGYRQLAILALSTPVLMGTVISISTTYMHLRGSAPMFLALQHQSRALATLRDSLGSLSSSVVKECNGHLKRDLLATILLQITVEMASGGSGAKTHIAYAWNLFRELGYDRRKPTCSIGTVLVQRMTWIDTISSIFWQRRPFLPLSFWFFNYNQDSPNDGDSQPTVQETTGCPQWVISFLARISHLYADYSDGLPSFLLMPQAKELELDLNMSARNYFNRTTAPYKNLSNRQRHLDVVGQCFYWSAVLLLQRRIFRDRRDSPRVQSSLTVLIELMESLPIGCGPDSALSLPLYLAAHEAIEPDHRTHIRSKSRQLTAEYPSKTREILTREYEIIWADIDRSASEDGSLVTTHAGSMSGERYAVHYTSLI